MNQRLVRCFGLNYKTAPLQLRERLGSSLPELMECCRKSPLEFGGIEELAWLQTCNRVELYVRAKSEDSVDRKLLELLISTATDVGISEIRGRSYYKEGEKAVLHLCRVAAGLESAVLGENQILGQVVECFEKALKKKCVRANGLGSVFKVAIEAGRKARSNTAINRRPASFGSAALDWARKEIGSLKNKHIVVVGLGEMGALAVKTLSVRRLTNLVVINRTDSRARSLARKYKCAWLPFDELLKSFVRADLVILATAASVPFVTEEMIRSAIAMREDRPLALVDLGVPRNVESKAGKLEGVIVCDSDRLQAELAGALTARHLEIPGVEAIIENELERFGQVSRSDEDPSYLLDLRRTVESIRKNELERLFRHLGPLDEGASDHICRFSQALVNKILHEPTVRIKKASHSQGPAYEGSVRELFGLSAEQETGVT